MERISEDRIGAADRALLSDSGSLKGLECEVLPQSAAIGIDLRFHTGYTLSIPLRSLAGSGGDLLTLLQVTPLDQPRQATIFAVHVPVPPIPAKAKGQVQFSNEYAVGAGRYRVDWLTREGRIGCSAHWQIEARLAGGLQRAPVALAAGAVDELAPDPFQVRPQTVDRSGRPLYVKVLVNFAPSAGHLGMLSRDDVRAITGILLAVAHERSFGRFSVVAFATDQERVIYRQEPGTHIDFPTLGKAVAGLQSGTVSIRQIEDPGSDAAFLADLLAAEFRQGGPAPDAVIVVSPDVTLGGKIEYKRLMRLQCPVFYLNYKPDAIDNPWRGEVSAVIKAYHGLIYSITRPNDLGSAVLDIDSRLDSTRSGWIARAKE